MNLRPLSPDRRTLRVPPAEGSGWTRALGLLLPVLLLLLPRPGTSTSLAAQQPPTLVERQLAYEEAKSLYEAAVLAWSARAQRYERELSRANSLRGAGSEEQLEAVHRAFYAEALALQQLDLRVAGTRQRLEETRERLLDAMDRRREELEEELESAETAAERAEARNLLVDLGNQYRQIEEEAGQPGESRLALYSAIEPRPLDGAFELRNKARLLKRRAGEAEAQLEEMDREIDRLRARQRIQRNRRDFEAGLSRFDDTRPPVGPPGNRNIGGNELPTDTTALATAGSLAERIDLLVDLRDRLEVFRDQLIAKAEDFETRLRRITT